MTDLQLSGDAQNRSSLLIEFIDLLVECEMPLARSLGASPFATGSFLTQSGLQASVRSFLVGKLGVTEEALDSFPQIF